MFVMVAVEFETVSSSLSIGTASLRWSIDAGLVVPMPTLPEDVINIVETLLLFLMLNPPEP